MLRITASVVTCVLCAVSSAFGYIQVWDGDDITPAPTIDHDENTITINAAGEYGFRAWDGSSALEEIRNITVASGVSGAVTVTIAWDEYGGAGATDIWEADLTHSTEAVTLSGLTISGDLGHVGDGSSNTIALDVAGSSTTNMPITAGGLLVADISADSLSDITVSGAGTHGGSITTTGDYKYTLTLGQDPNHPSTINTDISIGGFHGLANNAGGRFYLYGDMYGEITCPGNWCGSMYLTGDLCNDINIGIDFGIETADYDRAKAST